MDPGGLVGLLGLFEELRPAFTQPSFHNALVIFVGWVLTSGPHAVTQALVATDVARRSHWEAFHRFFSRGTWSPDRLGQLVFARIIAKLCPTGTIGLVIDDTLTPKKGPHVFGLGTHLDAVRSTKKHQVFCFGHVWVVISVVVRLPFSASPWSLPVGFRLYRNLKESGDAYKKKTELARELLDLVASWCPDRDLRVSMDCAYCNATVMKDLPKRILVFGAMRPDAVLTAEPSKRKRRGRRPVRGGALPKPEAIARSRSAWSTCKAVLYGKTQVVHYKALVAQWYRVCGPLLLKIVVVRVDHGAIRLRVFFCTDTSLTVQQILEGYADRWSIEVCFRNLKQLFGFADSQARKKESVERTAPFVGCIYSLLVIWFAEGAFQSPAAALPIRPWYRHKKGLCFADVLRAAQRVLLPLDVLDPARALANLRDESGAPAFPGNEPRRAAS